MSLRCERHGRRQGKRIWLRGESRGYLWVGGDGGQASRSMLDRRLLRRWVDPGRFGQSGWFWRPGETFGVRSVGGKEDFTTSGADLRCGAVVDRLRGHKAEARVAVLGVVVREEDAAETSRVLDGPEAVRKLRAVLERLEVRFGERVVVRDVGARVRFGDAEVGEEKRHRLADHRGAAIGVNDELPGSDLLLTAALFDQPMGERPGLLADHHPSDDESAEDVEQDVEVEVGPLHRPQEFPDVPRPDLIGTGGEQLGLLVARMPQLIAPLADLSGLGQDAIHRTDRAVVGPLVEELHPDLRRGFVDEAFAVQRGEHRGALFGRESARRRASFRGSLRGRLLASMQGGSREAERLADRRSADIARKLRRGEHQSISSTSIFARGIPRISETFFWISMIASACASRCSSRAFSLSSCWMRGSTA